MAKQEIRVPDLEGAEDVGVVEIYVSVGEEIEEETPLISLESDKAVMDVPSPTAGRILELKLKEGDTVNAGDVIAVAESADSGESSGSDSASSDSEEPHEGDSGSAEEESRAKKGAESKGSTSEAGTGIGQIQEIRVPDLEGSTDVAVVEVYVSSGDAIETETPLISLESDKAVMDVPSPVAGTIEDMKISEGDTVNAGDLLATVRTAAEPDKQQSESAGSEEETESTPAKGASQTEPPGSPGKTGQSPKAADGPVNRQPMGSESHATPSVRGLARELGVDLSNVNSSGPKGRITRDDLTSMVKSVLSGAAPAAGSGGGFSLPPIPSADFAAFGETSVEDLSRIKRISGPHLHRNWLGIPHVTQFEDADITELEAFRKELNAAATRSGEAKISPLIFIIKAVAKALLEFPDFNSSLNPDGATITRKNFVNIGIAVDTPGGLVVPVIRDADRKGVRELAAELADLSTRARDGKLKAGEMKGAGFSISSLGGIGGTYFTPIINAPEVAILGLSRSAMKPVWNGTEFEPRLILPFSVSYDHRVIDGAQGARFAAYLSKLIADLRRALL